MKSLILMTYLLFTSTVYASGCLPSDFHLVEEKVITTLEELYTGTYQCYVPKDICVINLQQVSPGHLNYELVAYNTGNIISESIQFKNLQIKIYQQHYWGSCDGDFYRITYGIDLDEMRFRSEKDMI